MRRFFMGGLGAEGAIRDPKFQKEHSSDKLRKVKKVKKSSKWAQELTTRPETCSGWFPSLNNQFPTIFGQIPGKIPPKISQKKLVYIFIPESFCWRVLARLGGLLFFRSGVWTDSGRRRGAATRRRHDKIDENLWVFSANPKSTIAKTGVL